MKISYSKQPTFTVKNRSGTRSLPDRLCDPALCSNISRQSLKTNLFQRYHSAHTAQ